MKMSICLKALTASVLVLALTLPVAGQKTGTRIDKNIAAPGSVSDAGVKSAIMVANGFGKCLARREGKRSRAALDMQLLSPEQGKVFDRQMEQFDGCLGDSSEFDQLRSGRLPVLGGAFEWFVNGDLKKADLSSLQDMTDDVLMTTEFRPRTALEDFGLCVIRRNLSKSKSLLDAAPTSTEEIVAVRAITPELGPCISEGTELKMNAPNIRAIIAFALYRAASKLEKSDA